ncbi:MAG TPA: two-component regulator propeller domain-containing protein [Pyrinomonadaceae bacterium]|jgi:ligand-binding sensor domain-containing protein
MKSRAANPKGTIQRHLSRFLLVFVFGALFCASAAGLDRDRTITELHHTAWTDVQGAPGHITAIGQTSDGYLWLGTLTGLFRFDGIRFERFVPRPGSNFISNGIYSLLATPDGGLWIGYVFGGVSFLKDGILTNYGVPEGLPAGRVRNFARDAEGNIWAAIDGGLARLEGERWHQIGAEWNFPHPSSHSVFVDKEGTLWVATQDTVVFLPRGARSFQNTTEQNGMVPMMARSPDGSMWMAEVGKAVRQMKLPGIDLRSIGPEVRVGSKALLFDREGALWITTIGDGMRRVPYTDRLRGQSIAQFGNEAEIFTEKEGLSGNYIYTIFEDREGNIWIGTANGLDRFRESDIVPVRLPPGDMHFGLAANEGGEVWAVSMTREIFKIRGSTPTHLEIGRNGVPFKDEEGTLWVGGGLGGQEIFRLQGDKAQDIKKLNLNLPYFNINAFFKDRLGVFWVSVTQGGIFRLKDDVWEPYDRQPELPKSTLIVATVDSLNRKWFGYSGNALTVIDGDNIRTFSPEDGLRVGDVMVIRERNGHVWVGGSLGVAILEGDRFRMLSSEGSQSFNGVSGIVETSDGAL